MKIAMDDQKEWTVISRKPAPWKKKKKGRNGHRNEVTDAKDTGPDENHVAGIIKRLSALAIENRKLALASNISAMYRDQLKEHFPVQRAVIVGLGNMDPATNHDVTRARTQFGLFYEICRGLISPSVDLVEPEEPGRKSKDSKPIKVPIPTVAQDPVFTATDRAALEAMNISVLGVPQANDSIDETTFVFAPFVQVNILLPEILAGKKMALYVGTDIQEVADSLSRESYLQRFVAVPRNRDRTNCEALTWKESLLKNV